MHPDRKLALLRLFLQIFIFGFVGFGSYYLGSLADLMPWKSLAIGWGICALLLFLEQYRNATEDLRTGTMQL